MLSDISEDPYANLRLNGVEIFRLTIVSREKQIVLIGVADTVLGRGKMLNYVYDEQFCERLVKEARRRALRIGMTRDEADDCGQGFAAHVYDKGGQVLRFGTHGRDADAWIAWCADNWARNVHRNLRRLRHRETRWQTQGSDDRLIDVQVAGRDPSPEYYVLQRELQNRISCAVALLSTTQREIYVLRFVHNRSVQELAVASRRTPNAVRQALWALRKRLRAILEEQGFDVEEAGQYLCDISASRDAGQPQCAESSEWYPSSVRRHL